MDVQTTLLKVEAYVQDHLDQYVEELRELCAIDSNSYSKKGLDEIALILAARLRGIGMHADIIEREEWGNDLFGIIQGTGNLNVLILCHTDTVYPVGTAVGRPLQIKGDTILGPGVCDMKGCILSAIYALEALLAVNYRSFGEIRLLCVSDEEISQRHSADLVIQACQNCQRALIMEAGRANGDIVSARKGNAWYTFTARGHCAHTGVEPEKGRNAITEIMHQMLRFLSLEGWREGITINPGVITGGITPNVVPDYAQVRFDLRYLRKVDRIATEQRFREMMKDMRVPGVELTLELEPYRKEPMECTSEVQKLANEAIDIANMLGFSLNHALTGGSSDSSFTSELVPTLDGLGPVGGFDHGPDEYILMSSIAPRAALLAGLIMEEEK